MMNFKEQRVLILAPHPDDEVLGCGGFINRFKREGAEVFVLYMTVGTTKDFSKKGLSTQEERMKEIEKVAAFLRLDGYRIAFPGNDYHLKLDAVPQKDLINEIERGDNISLEILKPTIVLIPSSFDYNQDHNAVCDAAIAATRPTPPEYKAFQPLVLTYELPYGAWTSLDAMPHPNFFVALQKEDLYAKGKALTLYQSQLKNAKGPLSVHGISVLANMRGFQSGMELAEAFFLKRYVV